MTLINADDVFFQGVAAFSGFILTAGVHQEGCVRPEMRAFLVRMLDGVSVPFSLEADIFWDGLESCFWEELAIIPGKKGHLE